MAEVTWKRDPADSGLVHTVTSFSFGTASTDCGKTFPVETAKSEVPSKHQRSCDDCRSSRLVTADYPASAWDTGTDYGPR